MNKNDYSKMWKTLIADNFDQNLLIKQLEQVGDKLEDIYLEYITRKFRHRTISEWMKFYKSEDKKDQYKTIKSSDLAPREQYEAIINVTKAQYAESTLGKTTLQNLLSFQEKYMNLNLKKKSTRKVARATKAFNTTANISGQINQLHSEKKKVKKLKWSGTKSEFARFIRDEYCKNQKQYKSLREASVKLFDKYDLDFENWDKEKCYGFVRKV